MKRFLNNQIQKQDILNIRNSQYKKLETEYNELLCKVGKRITILKN